MSETKDRFRPIRDYNDVDRVLAEIRRPSEEDWIEGAALKAALKYNLDGYLSYCPKYSLKPTASGLLCYLMNYLIKKPTSEVAQEMGMATADLLAIENGARTPTPAEAELFGDFFHAVPDAFLVRRDDTDDDDALSDDPLPLHGWWRFNALLELPQFGKDESAQLRPIRDYRDVDRAQAEAARLCAIPSEQMSDAEVDLVSAITRNMRLYMGYCQPRSLKPASAQFLRYLLSCVVNKPKEQAAQEMEIAPAELLAIMNGERMPTPAEAEMFANYFQAAADAFLVPPNPARD